MSCEHEHEHEHTHGPGDIHIHPPHEPELPTSPAQSLLPYVDLPRVAAQNAVNPAAAPLLLRTYAARDALNPQLAPQLAPEDYSLPTDNAEPTDLLLSIPLTIPCRLFSLLLRFVHVTAPDANTETEVGVDNTHFPVHLYRNPRDSSIDTIANLSARGPPKTLSGASLFHPTSIDTHCEHHLPRRYFANTTELVIYFPSFPHDLALVCVELRGEPLHKPSNRGLPTSLQVETAPRLEDHPHVHNLESFKQHLT